MARPGDGSLWLFSLWSFFVRVRPPPANTHSRVQAAHLRPDAPRSSGRHGSRVAPRGILLGHAHDEPSDLREHARTPAPPLRVRPFARDELPMPPENRVGRDNRGDLAQPATT